MVAISESATPHPVLAIARTTLSLKGRGYTADVARSYFTIASNDGDYPNNFFNSALNSGAMSSRASA